MNGTHPGSISNKLPVVLESPPPELQPRSSKRKPIAKSVQQKLLLSYPELKPTSSLENLFIPEEEIVHIPLNTEEPRSTTSSVYGDNEDNASDFTVYNDVDTSAENSPRQPSKIARQKDADLSNETLFQALSELKVQSDPISVQTYTHYVTADSAELLIQMSAANKPNHLDYERTLKDEEQSSDYTTHVSWATDISELPLASADMGVVRMRSEFQASEDPDRHLIAYLYARYLVVLQPSDDGFDEVDAIFDLEDDETIVYTHDMHLILNRQNKSYQLLSPSKFQLDFWLAAINDKHLSCPSDLTSQAGKAFQTGMDDFVAGGMIEMICCLPLNLVASLLPHILSRLRSQDRLGLVVVSKDGSRAFLDLHKPSWPEWKYLMNINMSSLDLFRAAHNSILDTAAKILRGSISPRTGLISQSVILLAGCPVNHTNPFPSSIAVHTIGFGKYDFTSLSRISDQHARALFQHAESQNEVLSCVAGLIASEQSVVYDDVILDITIPVGNYIVANVGESSGAATFRKTQKHDNGDTQVKINLGSLIGGQTRGLVFEVKMGDDLESQQELLQDIKVSCLSTLTGLRVQPRVSKFSRQIGPYAVTSVPLPMMFSRMTRIIAEVLAQCFELAAESNWTVLYDFIDRAVETAKACLQQRRMHNHDSSSDSLVAGDFKSDTAWEKMELLAQGLAEFRTRFYNVLKSAKSYSILPIIYEAQQTLEMQRAVTSRSRLDRLFSEELDSNFF